MSYYSKSKWRNRCTIQLKMGATYCLAMINRPEDLNIETRRGSPYHVWNRRIRIKRITPARFGLCSFP
jgi:hypothetical protein